MEWIELIGELLTLAVIVGLIVGQARLGKRIEDLKFVSVWTERRLTDLEVKAAPKKPAARKTPLKKEAK